MGKFNFFTNQTAKARPLQHAIPSSPAIASSIELLAQHLADPLCSTPA